MKIRIGIEGGRRPVLAKAKEIGAPILVSANSLWRNGKFGSFKCYMDHDVALDSGGFVAMKKYGGYRWSVAEYAALAKQMSPSWWAQMDFCCEPEIASTPHEVFKRIDLTVQHLHECRKASVGNIQPMPVLQGWKPADYCSGPIYDSNFDWPDLIGIGSICRRHVWGPNGIIEIISAVDSKVPPHVKFHLFGVKSKALEKLIECFGERIASVDSMAWSFAARLDAFKQNRTSDGFVRAEYMANWFKTQSDKILNLNPQLSLRFSSSP